MQIVENWSRVRGRIEAWQPPDKAGEPGTLTLAVEHVEEVASRDGPPHRNLLAHTKGTTVKVVVPASAFEHVAPTKGATVVLEVRRGESPGRVFAHPERIKITS